MSAPIKSPEFYADFQGLAALKRDAKAQSPDALKEAAKQFESLFTRMLLKSMRATSMGDELFDSQQTQFYQDMFDDQMAVHLSQGKGMGLADMLVRQLQQAQPAATGPAAAGHGTRDLGPGVEKNPEGGRAIPQAERASTPKPQAPGPESNTKQDFITSMLPHAERAARTLGVDPHALIAQAALETGWGKSLPSHAGGNSSFNLFGIKAGTSWSGATVASRTLEFDAGVAVTKQEKFRAYDSAADSFNDYAALLGRSPRYAAARNTGSNVHAFAQALQAGGYATDPNYAQKLSALTQQVRALASADGNANALKFANAAPLMNNEGVRG
ncbi:MAG: flagellar assembly peptidoglycan hydrolase FlgJ [Steroidobacteraceae bacterium]